MSKRLRNNNSSEIQTIDVQKLSKLLNETQILKVRIGSSSNGKVLDIETSKQPIWILINEYPNIHGAVSWNNETKELIIHVLSV